MKYIPFSLILICCFIFSGMIFKSLTPPKCEKLSNNATVFVLTGDPRRIPYAIDKIQNLENPNLYIIGVGAKTNLPNTKHIIIETNSKSTYQNSLVIKDIVKTNNLNHIVLITTEDHMNRALYLIKKELPDTDIVSCPVPLTGMNVPERIKRWTIEYLKYCVTLLGIKES